MTAVSLEGSRPFLVEVQALIDDTSETNKRLSVGIDTNRISLLIAVLQKHGKLNIGNGDVYVNLVGGMRSNETAIDLPLSLVLSPSFKVFWIGQFHWVLRVLVRFNTDYLF